MITGLLLIGMSIGLVYRKSGNCWADRSDLRAESVDTILRGPTARERKIDTIMETDCPARHVDDRHGHKRGSITIPSLKKQAYGI